MSNPLLRPAAAAPPAVTPVSAHPTDEQLTVVAPHGISVRARLVEAFEYRHLASYFARLALEKTFARTYLGRVWVLLRPLLDIGIRSLVFGGLLRAPSSGSVPYLVFLVTSLTAWVLFDRTVMWATRSIELNRKMVSSTYFPRILLPFSCTAPALVEFAIYLGICIVIGGIYSIIDGAMYFELTLRLLAAAGGFCLIVLFAWGIGLWTSVLGASYRDLRFSLSYILGFASLASPIAFPLDSIPERFSIVGDANPLAPLIELVRWGMIDAGRVMPTHLAVIAAAIVVIWAGGFWYFFRAEGRTIDRI